MARLDRPNIIVAVFDSLSEQACIALEDKLPTLSKLRTSSTHFSNCYVCSPESGPARASLFTGLDMAAHGVWTDGVALPDNEQTFVQKFAQSGYQTWLVGRRQLAGVSNWTTEHTRPFEFAQAAWAHGALHRSRQNAYLDWLQRHAPEAYEAIFPTEADPDDTIISQDQRAAILSLSDKDCFNTWVGAQAIEFISSSSGNQPFLGIAGFVVGETMGGEPTNSEFCEAIIEQALQQADAALNAILRHLEETGLADNTILVVTAGRGSVATAQANASMTESAIKVPLVINAQGVEARSNKAPVSTMDIAPTLYHLAQVPPPIRMQGVPLLNENSKTSSRNWAMSRLRNPNTAWQTSLCTQRWKLVMTHSQPNTHNKPIYALYDLKNDPDETKDIAKDAAHLKELEAMIDLMIDARVALEDRTEPRIAKF